MAQKKTAPPARSKKTTDNSEQELPQHKAKAETGLATSRKMSVEELENLIHQDQGAGQENMSAKDMSIPRISLLQSGSPQVKKSEGAYIKGAEEGDFFDNVTNTIFAKGDEGFLFIPVSYRRANIEWIPKDDGGGFVADHGADDSILQKCTKDEKNRMLLKNGHEIVTTAEYFIMALNREMNKVRRAVISLAKTQLKAARNLNTVVNELQIPKPNKQPGTFNPAMFYSVFDVTSVPMSKDGFNWMGWNVIRSGDTLSLPDGQNLYLAARSFREAVSDGAVVVAKPVDETVGCGGDPDDKGTL